MKSGVEYADYQITVYPPPCPYRCVYCFWNTPLMRARASTIRKRFSLERRLKEAEKLRKKQATIVVSFTTDPYPPEERENGYTRQILERLAGGRAKVMILTKNPGLAVDRDLALIKDNGFWLGTTVTCLPPRYRLPVNDDVCRALEPLAPSPWDRLDALAIAHMAGVKTWLSIEPIHAKTVTTLILGYTWRFVDMYVLGSLNYASQLGIQELQMSPSMLKYEWQYIMDFLKKHGNGKKTIIIKKELRRRLSKLGIDVPQVIHV